MEVGCGEGSPSLLSKDACGILRPCCSYYSLQSVSVKCGRFWRCGRWAGDGVKNAGDLVGLHIVTQPCELQQQLHWLPVCHHISFKLGTITFRAIHTGTPTYLACELHRFYNCVTLLPPCTGLMPPLTSQTLICSLCSGYSEQYASFHPNNMPASIRDSVTLATYP